jgi:hypothetical protein
MLIVKLYLFRGYIHPLIYLFTFLLLHRAFWTLKLVTHQQMHYLLNLERFNFTLKCSTQHTRHSQDMLPHHHITYKDISAVT